MNRAKFNWKQLPVLFTHIIYLAYILFHEFWFDDKQKEWIFDWQHEIQDTENHINFDMK